MAGDMTNKEIKHKFEKLRLKCLKLGISGDELNDLPCMELLRNHSLLKQQKYLQILGGLVLLFMATLMGVLFVWVIQWPITRLQMIDAWFYIYRMDTEQEVCVLKNWDVIQDLTRPPVSCKMCNSIKNIPRVSNITPEVFEEKYAYSGIPVIITDAMKNWTAVQSFNFEFFKSIYSEDSPTLINVERNCQFFPYKTSFQSLGQVFNMSEERANLKDGTEPWYVGWSNCDSSATNVLRSHYERPYFLPKFAESSRIDWIFMGSPGYGAHMHIDNVGNPSWQAQITGTKLWTLIPPPECYFQCERKIELTVHPGEIVVLDTNNWYHSTLIVGNEMSITIGSEYD